VASLKLLLLSDCNVKRDRLKVVSNEVVHRHITVFGHLLIDPPPRKR
jgi:hypothetical protein